MSLQSNADYSVDVRLPPLPKHWLSLAHAFVDQAHSQPNALAVTDSTGARLTYKQLLLRAIGLANVLHESLDSSICVGLLLPPSAAAVIANIAVTLLGKVSVNLNYTFAQKMFDDCVKDCQLTCIVSSETVLKRLPVQPATRVITLEDVRDDLSLRTKVQAWLESELVPERMLAHLLPGLGPQSQLELCADGSIQERAAPHSVKRLADPATIIFTSGSTSVPKGVVLSHANILSNIHAVRHQGHVQPGEIVLGVIPFFHSFGFSITLWAPLCLGEMVVYHYNPLDAKRVGELCERTKATTMVCTPTMMSSYLRRCDPKQFSTVKNCILGGEKVMDNQLLELEKSLGQLPLQGYGLAETSPVISCNVAADVTLPDGRIVAGNKRGTVGLPLPGTIVRIANLDSGQVLPRGEEGMILVHGPQVMMGYLHQPQAQAKVLKDGWFTTGDIGFLDDDGFLTITGRLSQFAKIAGEMVPQLAVEEEIIRAAGVDSGNVTVTAVPDDEKGERLVVVYADDRIVPDQVVEKLRGADISRLWIPDSKDFIRVNELPVMTNGKLDLRRVKQMVNEHFRLP